MSLIPPEDSFYTAAAEDTTETSSLSTPPTTIADSSSAHSESPKQSDTVVIPHVPVPRNRPDIAPTATARRARRSTTNVTYNLAQLSGTAGHGWRRAKGDDVDEERWQRRRDRIAGRVKQENSESPQAKITVATESPTHSNIDALEPQESPQVLEVTRTRVEAQGSPRSQRTPQSSEPKRPSRITLRVNKSSAVSNLTDKLSKLGKRNRKTKQQEPKPTKPMSRELRRLQDTKEFSHVDEQPVVHTVWSNGKFVDPKKAKKPEPKKRKAEEISEGSKEEEEPITNIRKRRQKKYLDKGLYSGQETPQDMTLCLSKPEKKKLAALPELAPSGRENKTMPLPIFAGLRTLIHGRDFKLPYHICNPLPPGQPKPDEWKKMTKNRFIGESRDYWRKSPHFHDYSSKCVCTPEDGCGESCQNRIMLYECDDQNCNAGKKYCSNRAFATLTARRNKGGKYRVGVEVIKTSDRGYGVRSNRCFKPNQIIMEYAGEIITEEECERRMTEVYKDNECYYLMSFDQNMIIDATTGSIARFVNHSCNPNCRMIKWIVSGQPRMALFAGDKPIMTGDELTYDYNFDPFSAKNVQKCLCGEPNCRGVLGPKPREVKPPKDIKGAVKATVKAGKRKLKELVGDDEAAGHKAKKRKIQPAKGVKRSISAAGVKAAKGATSAIRRAIANKAKKTTVLAKTAVNRRASTGESLQKTTTKRIVKTYGRPSPRQRFSTGALGYDTIVAEETEVTKTITKTTPMKRTAIMTGTRVRHSLGPVSSPRAAIELPRSDTVQVAAPESDNVSDSVQVAEPQADSVQVAEPPADSVMVVASE